METSYQITKFTLEKAPRKGAWLKCETCKKEFYVFPSRIKNANPRYCSRKCYNKFGKNNPFYGKKHSEDSLRRMIEQPNRHSFKTGKDNPNFIRFGKDSGFFGNHFAWWKRWLKKNIGKCELCGFNDNRIFQVHHKDHNTKNNTRENLILLCPNCHALEHWKDKTGYYHWFSKD